MLLLDFDEVAGTHLWGCVSIGRLAGGQSGIYTTAMSSYSIVIMSSHSSDVLLILWKQLLSDINTCRLHVILRINYAAYGDSSYT